MSLYYLSPRPDFFRRYIGLSFILHVAGALSCWALLQTHVKVLRSTAIDIAIRTVPMPPSSRKAVPKPGQQAMPMPKMPAAHRKIGRIVEKKYKIDMPKIEPQTAMKRRRGDDEIQLLNDRSIAKLIRAEDVDPIEIERKQTYQPSMPQMQTPQANIPPGEYVPATPAPPVDVSIQYVEIPAFEESKIDLDSLEWSAPVTLSRQQGTDAGSKDAAALSAESTPGKRRAIKVIKPEIPPNLGIQESKVEVVVRLVIAESGFVSSAELERSGGYMELDNRALSAVRQWIYESARQKETRLVTVNYVF